jgi:hypothetical protein
MDLMKPYMPPTPRTTSGSCGTSTCATIQMWAGCIWVPIYEVMTRKHLRLVTLEENLRWPPDIGIDATTSLDEAFAAAMAEHGPDAKVILLPFARYQLPRNMVRLDAEPLRFPQERTRRSARTRRRDADPRVDDHRRVAAPLSRRRGAPASCRSSAGRARTAAARSTSR